MYTCIEIPLCMWINSSELEVKR